MSNTARIRQGQEKTLRKGEYVMFGQELMYLGFIPDRILRDFELSPGRFGIRNGYASFSFYEKTKGKIAVGGYAYDIVGEPSSDEITLRYDAPIRFE